MQHFYDQNMGINIPVINALCDIYPAAIMLFMFCDSNFYKTVLKNSCIYV